MTSRDPRMLPYDPRNAPVSGPYAPRAAFQPFAGPVQGQGPGYVAGAPTGPVTGAPGLPLGETPRLGPPGINGAPVILQPVGQMVTPETAPDRLIRPRGFERLAGGALQDNVNVTFNDDCYVLGIKCGVKAVESQDALIEAMSSLSVKIQIGGEGGYLTLDGIAQQYLLLSEISGVWGQLWLPFYRPVSRREVWTFYTQNEGTDEVGWAPSVALKIRSLTSLGLT